MLRNDPNWIAGNKLEYHNLFLFILLITVNVFNAGEYQGHYTELAHKWSNTDKSYYCYDETSYVLLSIVKTMNWKNVAIVYECSDDEFVRHLSEYFEGSYSDLKFKYYDITNMNRSHIDQVLTTLYGKTSMGIVLLLNDKTLHFLQLVNLFDYNSNKTTNFRTNSNWVILINSEKNRHLVKLNLELNHVVLLQCWIDHIESWTLLHDNTMKIVECLFVKDTKYIDVDNMECQPDSLFPDYKFKLNGRHLVIGTIEVEDFMQIHTDKNNQTVYEGSLADLTVLLSHSLNFTYTFIHPPDLQYGIKKNNSWNGLVGQLVRQEVDMVIADLTVTNERLQVIDFILPAFLNQNLGVLYRKGILEESNWVKVFRPLHPYVYFSIFGCILIIGVLLYVLDVTHDTCSLQSKSCYKHQVFTFFISLTNLIGFISLNGNGLWPRQVPARILVAFFWLFCVVITATYIGNLTAKLTEKIETKPFTSMDELVTLPDWKWGLNGGGLTQQMFENSSKGSLLNRFWEGIIRFNKTDITVLERNYKYHLDRVLNSDEKYAQVVLGAKYYMLSSNHCKLGLVDSVISSLSLAVAVTKNSYLKEELERCMWALSNSGHLKPIEDKQNKDRRPTICKLTETKRPMHLEDMLGLVLLISFGLGMSIFVLLIEIYMNNFR